MKKIFYIYPLYLLLCIATLPAQQLQLPNEDIIGVSEATTDTLNVSKDLSEYYLFDDLERLQYRPVVEPNLKGTSAANQHGYAYLKGNTTPFADIKFGLFNKELGYLHGLALYKKYNDNGKDNQDYTFQKYKIDYATMDYYTDLRLQFGLFGRYNISELDKAESKIQTIGAIISATPKIYAPFASAELQWKILSYTFADNNQQTTPEVLTKIAFSEWLILTDSDITALYYYDKPHVYSNMFLAIPNIDLFALHLQASKNFTPSITINKTFELSEDSDLSFSNYPHLKAPSLFDFYDNYPFADLEDIMYAQQVPLNTFITLNWYKPLQMDLFLNAQYIKNYLYIGQTGWMSDNAMLGSANANIKKRIGDFTIAVSAMAQVTNMSESDSRIPWEPHIEITPWASYQYKMFTTLLEFSAQTTRYDAENKPIKQELYLLNSKNTLDINQHFKVDLNLLNILNNNYKTINGLPEEAFQAELELRILF